ncbi:MAG TPA: WD40 repeat domain-containing protein [Xanthobacteraceae bacterium]|nr:WD40 repeat domain-containing protein [Xanthobacteraceae bacterium]
MSDARTDTASIVERIQPVAAGGAVVAVHFLGDDAVFVLGEEALHVWRDGEERRVAVHGGAILASAGDGHRIVTGGDDGKVVTTDPQGASETLASDAKRRWIDHVALGPDGIAWSCGKQAFVRSTKGKAAAERTLDLPSSAGGLAFAPKGFRLAIAHYNGATLWFPNAPDAKPERLEWKGSHLDLTFSPDGRFLVTAMQEPTLHGWRLIDGKHMRMSGYAAKVRSLSWGPGAKWLATSGASQLVVWPFAGKDGPMGKAPKILSPSEHRICAVAAHPKQEVCAVGYEDGMLLLTRIEDGAEVLARAPGAAPIAALAWNASGNRLAFGTEDGEAGVIAL